MGPRVIKSQMSSRVFGVLVVFKGFRVVKSQRGLKGLQVIKGLKGPYGYEGSKGSQNLDGVKGLKWYCEGHQVRQDLWGSCWVLGGLKALNGLQVLKGLWGVKGTKGMEVSGTRMHARTHRRTDTHSSFYSMENYERINEQTTK